MKNLGCDFLILGDGYTASFLKELLVLKAPQARIVASSRRLGQSDVVFDLNDATTWSTLPQAKVTFWLFPAEPPEQVENFIKDPIFSRLGKLIVVGSTSALEQPETEAGIVNEDSSLDLSKDRVVGEDLLRSKGAVLLLSAGIYGPSRDPKNWVREGRVSSSPSFVNMIHVLDLCEFIYASATCGKEQALYIASDGNPQRWSDIIAHWQQAGLVDDSIRSQPVGKKSKCVNNQRSQQELNYRPTRVNFKENAITLEL